MRFEIEVDAEDGEGDYYSSSCGLFQLMGQLCAIVGHRPGDEREETEGGGKVWRWRNCSNCWAVTSGEQPKPMALLVMSMQRMYDPVMLAEMERQPSPFYDEVEGA